MKQWLKARFQTLVYDSVRDAVADSLASAGGRSLRNAVTEALRAWSPPRQRPLLPAGVAVHYPSDVARGCVRGQSGLVAAGAAFEFEIHVWCPVPPGVVLAVWGPVTIERVLCGTLVVANEGDQLVTLPALQVGQVVRVRVKAWEW